MTITAQQLVNEIMTAVTDHDPYVFGGISLIHGADCSGEFVGAQEALGLPHAQRTSQEMFAAWPKAPGPALGVAVFFNVPSDGTAPGDQPGHVGLCLNATTMEEEPHTGLDAEVVKIPNIPGVESIMGYRYVPGVDYGAPATTAPSQPAAPAAPSAPQQEADMSWFATDPKTGGVWATDPNGDLYPTGGAPFVEALSQHPEYHAGAAESIDSNPCVGMAYWAAFGNDGIMYFTQPSNGQGGWDGSTKLGAVPYDIYRFKRDGTPA